MTSNAILEFKGRSEFEERTLAAKKSLAGKKPAVKVKALKAYLPTGSKTKNAWEEAVDGNFYTFYKYIFSN